MKRAPIRFAFVMAIAAIWPIYTAVAVRAAATMPLIVPGQIIVETRVPGDADAIDAEYGSETLDEPTSTIANLATPVNETDQSFIAQLSTDPRVLRVERNRLIGVTEVRGLQFHFAFDKGPNPGGYVDQGAYTMVDVPTGSRAQALGAGVIVAVLDTGADLSHPALQGHLGAGFNALDPAAPPADIPDGVSNAAVGHGTMICGIIARIAPGALIEPVRVLNADGYGTLSNILDGLAWASANGARVVNMSFGTRVHSRVLDDELASLANSGTVLIAAAGNAGGVFPYFPAASAGVVGVASVNADFTKSDYSNYGPAIDVVAPGTGIRSTFWNGGYADWSGTSFSAAFVSGEAAALASVFPKMTSETMRELMGDSATNVNSYNPLYRRQLGAGLIDIGCAVTPDN